MSSGLATENHNRSMTILALSLKTPFFLIFLITKYLIIDCNALRCTCMTDDYILKSSVADCIALHFHMCCLRMSKFLSSPAPQSPVLQLE